MVQCQLKEHEDEEEVPDAFFDIVCCPNELNRSSSQAPTELPSSSSSKIATKAKKLALTAVEDTHTAVHQQTEEHEDEHDVPDAFFDIVCCPNELNRSSSQAPTGVPSSSSKSVTKSSQLALTAIDDTHAAVQQQTEGHEDEEEVQEAFFDIVCCPNEITSSSSKKTPTKSTQLALNVVKDTHTQVQQQTEECEEEVEDAFFDIVCCPNEINRSSSQETTTLPSSLTKTAPPTQLPLIAVEDTNTQVQSNHATTLERPSSFNQSISLHHEPSTPNDEDEEQPSIKVQHSISQTRRGDDIAEQPSRSCSYASTTHGSFDEEQPNINIDVQRSISQIRRGDSIAIQPSLSHSYASSKHGREEKNGKSAEIPIRQRQQQVRMQEQEPKKRKQRTPRKKKFAKVATLCVCLCVCAGLIVLFLTNDVSPRDSDRDGLSDELELKLGTDPFNPDTDGDGIMDGEEDFSEQNIMAKSGKSGTTKTSSKSGKSNVSGKSAKSDMPSTKQSDSPSISSAPNAQP
eukprot:scaffold21575_cov172-Skeletonema_dohrnii-CCMP3373.AAC.1